MTIPLVANRNAIGNKSASCPSDHLPEASCSMRRTEAKRLYSQSAVEQVDSSPTFTDIYPLQHTRTSWEYLPLTACETSHPCESHGMAEERATTCVFSPCATADILLPDATPHARYHDYYCAVPRMAAV